jgi:hypothetical protein
MNPAGTKTIRPQDFPPAPRDIHRNSASGSSGAGGRLGILPHVCAGIVVFLILVWEIVVLLLGASFPAKVTKHHTAHSSKGGTTYIIDYSYGDRFTDHQEVNYAEYQRLKIGMPLAVKAFTVSSHSFSLLSDPLAPTLRQLGFFALFNCIWNGIMSVFVWNFYVLPWRRKWLARNGEPIMGRVTSKVSLPGKNGKTYTVKYSYVSSDGLARLGEMTVEAEAYKRARSGQDVIVLHDSMKPGHSAVYEFGEYRVKTQVEGISEMNESGSVRDF